jgi:hypothetical protein
LARLIDPETFPQLSAVLASGDLADDEGLDAEFDFGLDRVLDGIGVLVAGGRHR